MGKFGQAIRNVWRRFRIPLVCAIEMYIVLIYICTFTYKSIP